MPTAMDAETRNPRQDADSDQYGDQRECSADPNAQNIMHDIFLSPLIKGIRKCFSSLEVKRVEVSIGQ
jgi:hypothetical protein